MLQAAHGLVRCGACLSIFEADRNIVDPHSSASNDEREHHEDGSVFISAPEDYFNPAAFLASDEDRESAAPDDDWGQDEILYAKSDVKDSDFDVFAVDEEEEQYSSIREQVTDSNFDVFDSPRAPEAAPNPHNDVQNHEFDIYDAGERKLRPPEPNPDESDAEYQVRASFNFDSASAASGFSLSSLLSSLFPGSAKGSGRDQSARTASAKTRPKSHDDSLAGVVILPEGPDAATLLAARKKANEQSKNQPAGDAIESDHDSEFLYDDGDFEPVKSRFLDAGTVDAEHSPDNVGPSEAQLSDEQFAAALAADAEWEEADVELDERSFVILPVDPYQPSAFRSHTEDMPDRPEPTGNSPATPSSGKSPGPTGSPVNGRQQDQSGAAGMPMSAAPQASDFPDDQTTAGVPGPDEQSEQLESGRDQPSGKRPSGSGKDEIRARITASRLDDQDDPFEQLSEENLRAIRDVDSSLELEHRNGGRGKSRIALLTATFLLVGLVIALLYFWLRLPVLSQDPRYRPWYQSVCEILGCNLPPYVNPAEIVTDNLVVRSHPDRADTLELNAVFRNRAEFAQPFPLIELRFTDLNNSTVLSRQLLPDDYLPPALRGLPLMPSGAPVQITLELEDPGPRAVNYQLGFKAAPPRPGS